MTYQEIYEMLKSTGLPTTYHSYPINQTPKLPYIVFIYPNNNDVIADNINYQEIVSLNVELYTETKDFKIERKLENVLKENELVYSKTSTFLESETMWQILYQTEVIING